MSTRYILIFSIQEFYNELILLLSLQVQTLPSFWPRPRRRNCSARSRCCTPPSCLSVRNLNFFDVRISWRKSSSVCPNSTTLVLCIVLVRSGIGDDGGEDKCLPARCIYSSSLLGFAVWIIRWLSVGARIAYLGDANIYRTHHGRGMFSLKSFNRLKKSVQSSNPSCLPRFGVGKDTEIGTWE